LRKRWKEFPAVSDTSIVFVITVTVTVALVVTVALLVFQLSCGLCSQTSLLSLVLIIGRPWYNARPIFMTGTVAQEYTLLFLSLGW
jgi:hypothetical protein